MPMGSHATRGLTWRASSRSKDVYECKTKFSPFFVVVRIILVVISHEEEKEGLSRLISIAIAAFEDIVCIFETHEQFANVTPS